MMASDARGESPSFALAGTFNDWNPHDKTWTMRSVSADQFELVRFCQSGTYEFKFVADGDWQKQFGKAPHGQLARPGGDIALTIPVAGEYRILLNTKTRSWNVNMQSATKPKALFSHRWIGGNSLRLDASRSLQRAGHPISEFTWSLEPSQTTHASLRITENGRVAELSASKPGYFDVRLTVSDGEISDESITRLHLPQTFELGLDSEASDGDSIASDCILFPVDGGHRFACIVLNRPQNPANDRSLARLIDPFTRKVAAEKTLDAASASTRLVIYNNLTQQLSFTTDGFHRFVFRSEDYREHIKPEQIDRVAIVSEFNGWNATRTPLREVDDGHYEALVLLPDGRYEYKFLINGAIFLEDKHANPAFRDPDDQGGFNSGFIIGPDATTLGASKPNHINFAALRHSPNRPSDFSCMSEHIVDVTVRTLAKDVKTVTVVSPSPTFDNERRVDLVKRDTINGFDIWTARLHSQTRRLTYYIELVDEGTTAYLSKAGATEKKNDVHPWLQPLRPTFPTPDWAKHAMWYQIFPERFRNGDAANDPPRTAPWQHEWYKPYLAPVDVVKGSPYDFNESGDFYSHIYARRYGGDLQGVREKLPYLRELGVTAIYFNPIFLAQSLHKYDASDFRHIDDFFGVKDSLKKIEGETADPATWQWSESDKIFLEFIKEAHEQGFKVIIDGVFNHVGRDFWAFRDVLKHGKKSAYADWFDIVSWEPFQYKAWDAPNGSLPRLKHDDELGLAPVVREHLFAVTRRWMDPDGDGDPSDGIDGWRLDVAEDINEHFWSDWRKLVKEINPDAYIVAEIWHEAREWLDGRTFDAVMNYPFAEACQRFFVNEKTASAPHHFARELETMLSWYPPQATQVLQNLFDSHDTDRVASMLMNPDLEYDKGNRLQDNGPQYNPSRPSEAAYKKLMLMVGLQMTFPSAPMIYYGDELGMYGADDPSDRKPMYWPDLMPFDDPDERIHEELHQHYQHMIAARATYDVLQVGSFMHLEHEAGKDVFAFARQLNNQHAIIVINRGQTDMTVTLPVRWRDGTEVVRIESAEQVERVQPGNTKGRATIRIKPDAETIPIQNGRVRVTLTGPYSMAVLVSK